MHYQTCSNLWTRCAAFIRPSGQLVDGKHRTRLILGAGLAVALGFAFVPTSPLKAGSSSALEGSVSVLVAKRYTPAFQVIRLDGVEVRRFPASFVPPGALNNVSELANSRGEGVYASMVAIPEGQPLTRAVLIDATEKKRMASLLRAGSVAVSFSVDKSHAAGGWVQPGDTIAIFATPPFSSGSADSGIKGTHLLFSSMQVLAVDNLRLGQSLSNEKDSAKENMAEETSEDTQVRILTVLASPSQAEKLLDAREKGTLSVVLRALGDDPGWVHDTVKHPTEIPG